MKKKEEEEEEEEEEENASIHLTPFLDTTQLLLGGDKNTQAIMLLALDRQIAECGIVILTASPCLLGLYHAVNALCSNW